jgi:hypothetical protein
MEGSIRGDMSHFEAGIDAGKGRLTDKLLLLFYVPYTATSPKPLYCMQKDGACWQLSGDQHGRRSGVDAAVDRWVFPIPAVISFSAPLQPLQDIQIVCKGRNSSASIGEL